MTLPLPSLDDRRWADLVDEGRALIPLYAPGWTDHNVHDPGITFMELLGGIAESQIFRANVIGDARRLKFLGLIGIHTYPPQPARTVLSLVTSGTPFVHPLGVDLTSQRTGMLFVTCHDVTLIEGGLATVHAAVGGELRDLLPSLERGSDVDALGTEPARDDALVLGFEANAGAGEWLSLYFGVTHEPPGGRAACATPRHHNVDLAWELRTTPGVWQRLEASEVRDETRALTFGGRVLVKLPTDLLRERFRQDDRELYHLRARIEGGRYDRAPRLRRVFWNAVPVEQAVAGEGTRAIAPAATLHGAPPAAGDTVRIDAWFAADGSLTELKFGAPTAPEFHVSAFSAPTTTHSGAITLEPALVGRGDGRPLQEVALVPLVLSERTQIRSHEGGIEVDWALRHDFAASTPDDAHILLDPTSGMVRFGDGNAGRALPDGALVTASYFRSQGAAGNLEAGALDAISSSAAPAVASIGQPLPAIGGADAETLESAAARAVELVRGSGRAVTLADYVDLALSTPCAHVARAHAWANIHPAFECLEASGIVTVVILPYLPVERPEPTSGLLHLVRSRLARRGVLGTRVEVTGPEYVEICVHAEVSACAGVSRVGLATRIEARLSEFLNPLTGGEDGAGWPFGRDVYRSEVMQRIDETEGVDHVLTLELSICGCQSFCSNVCVPFLGLVASGQHSIEVV